MVNIQIVVNMQFPLVAPFTDSASNNSFLILSIVPYETRRGLYPVCTTKLIIYN